MNNTCKSKQRPAVPVESTTTARVTAKFCCGGTLTDFSAVGNALHTRLIPVRLALTCGCACIRPCEEFTVSVHIHNHGDCVICSPRLSIQTCPGVQVCERPRVEDIAPGEGVDVTVRLAAGDAVGECCTLRAVLCFQSERQGECRLVSDVCRVAVSRVEANVRICKQISPSGAVAPGECVKVCLTVRNTGNVPLKEVCVTDEIPEGMRYCPGSTRVGGGPESAAFDKNPADGILLACLRPGETIRITYCICAHIAPEPR